MAKQMDVLKVGKMPRQMHACSDMMFPRAGKVLGIHAQR